MPFPSPPKDSAEAIVAAAVFTVRVSVTAPPDVGSAIDGGAKPQERPAGSVPQEKLTGPVNPPCDASVTVKVPELPRAIVRVAGLMLAVNPWFTMVSVKDAEELS